MGNKALLFIVLIAVLAPVYALFGVATAKNMEDNGIKRNDTYLSKGMCIGMCIGIVIGVVLGLAIWHTGSAACFAGCVGDIIGAAIGAAIGARMDKAKKAEA